MIKKLVLISLVFSFLGCTGRSSKEYTTVKEMVADAKTKVEYVSASELKQALDAHKAVYLVDCRENNEFDSACIKTAMNIPRGTLESTISEKAPKHRQTVYIYCDNGDRSTLAALVLPQLKYADVKVLEGGYNAFKMKFPNLVEKNPVRGNSSSKAPSKPSGGCGG